ncbi:nuclear transport factor 2 family protein [Alkalihalophilus lindianensis]|uniref:Nuclear transport factor 2 family protein n=1 Tax=Alkalihalophilus lindianensis TaxID=1630542 RepID=A0ABU3XFX6_9BACI|nr:nuclear transport factor 2 family protein [Alkalihalophilus lindianensis]MDV2686797.1 nuclear transport factor 2 family protein [Alkalihalophilus lindianensis]
MNKSILSISLFLVLAMLLVACGSNNSSEITEKNSNQSQEVSEMTNKEKAVAVLESLESGEKKAVEDFISSEKYIQHNLDFENGREGLIGSLDYLKSVGTKVDVKRVIEDGDLVAVHSEYELNGPKAVFDIFRFENGKIVEHWDNIQETVTDTASGHSMLDGETEIKDVDKTAENKELVENFVKDVLMGQNPDKLTSYFDGDNYIQHNPYIADGLSGLGKALEEWAKQGITMQYDKVHLVVAEGNFVLTVSEGTLGGSHTSFYDLFRVESGKIAEHWDVLETIPPKDEWKNNNGKF